MTTAAFSMPSSIDVTPYTGAVVMSGTLPAETHADVSSRPQISLDGSWAFQFDHKNRGLKEQWQRSGADDAWDTIPVPGTWDLHVYGGFDQQTIGWYARTFEAQRPPARLIKLHFGGIFREARLWLGGVELGRQRVPYVPFRYDVTGLIDAERPNMLVLRIDDRIRFFTLPCTNIFTGSKHGWMPYGGITRPVSLEVTLPLYVAQVRVDARLDGAVEAAVLLEQGVVKAAPSSYLFTAWITAREDDRVLHAWPEQHVPAKRTHVRLAGRLPDIRVWSPATPAHRYRLHLRLDDANGGTEHTGYDFAFRTFEARDRRFFLNGADHFLHGVNRHEDHPRHGPVYDRDALDEEVALLKELHVDFVRPGHYPVDVRVLQTLEEAGIMLVEEVPVYQLNTLQLMAPGLRRLANEALEVMILRDYNRPGIVMWSISNEIHPWFLAASSFTRKLYRAAKALDPTRPVMMARIAGPFPLSILDFFDRACGKVDAVGINQYAGWYWGRTRDATRLIKRIRGLHPKQTWFISEYGAGAVLGEHLDHPPGEEDTKDHSYTEEYQVYFHKQHIEQFLKLPFLCGMMPWVLSDFLMEWNPNTGRPHPVNLTNLKGLTSRERKRKAVFDVVAGYYRRRFVQGKR